MFGKHEVGSGGRWRQKWALGMSFFVHVQVSSFCILTNDLIACLSSNT